MLTSDAKVIQKRFAAELMLFEPSPSFNFAPTQQVLTVVFDKVRTIEGYRWGLVPRWAKDLSVGSKMINARAETLLDRPAYKPAFLHRRCLIPADGFYEWVKGGDQPGPRRFELPGKELFAFAGLWESWMSSEGDNIRTCTIITTSANEYVREIHDRMPVILGKDDEDLWLNPAAQVTDLFALLQPNVKLALTVTQVSKDLDKTISENQLQFEGV